jgi:SAM-dependent methyltransferase
LTFHRQILAIFLFLFFQSDQFPTYYEDFLDDPTIEIKIARVDLIHPDNILMFIFRQESATTGTVADLSDEARVMHPRQHLVYTYLAQHRLFRRIRFALEKFFARPLDLSFSTDRNTTMYESAKPMARLYQPLTFYNDTFILQEYFIPKQSFQKWYDQLKPIIQQNYEHLFILNLTIRFVKNDQTTFLSYTKNNDCYAFVFYFRIQRTEQGDQQAKELHQKLIELTFECQGTFYLPYRQHYSYEQMSIAYPMIENFFEKKLVYDPIGLFSNDWYENYRRNQKTISNEIISTKFDLITDQFKIVKERRTQSFHAVIYDDILREKFRKFLRNVFNVEPVHVIFNYVNRAVRNSANKNDADVYRDLQNILKTRQFASIRNIYALFKQILQLQGQIKDMLRQQITIFKDLGYIGKINDIVSIGDGGRCINQLRQILKIKDGRVFIINESKRLSDIIERNSLFSIGNFIEYNFKHLTDVPIPNESIDLVVCYMGLHHLPQNELDIFLKMIYRILRPNGLFLFREHNAYRELIPLLDVAHMVFNVVTGVSYESEINEIRAFRSIEQWRSCLRQIGFEDTFIYDEQEDDPTDDIMIVFRKPEEENRMKNDFQETIKNENYQKILANPQSNYFRPCEWLVVRILIQFGQYLNHTPFYYFPYMKFLSLFWSLFYSETELAVRKYDLKTALVSSPGFLMNVVVGVFLTILFLQLSFFSFLIRFVGQVRTIPEYEQLILQQTEQIQSDTFNFQNLIDHRIDHVQTLKTNGLYAIRVPRHHGFTSIIKKLALHSTKFDLLSISGQEGQIQIELTINNNDEQRLLWLKQRSNITIIFEYNNPIDNKQTHLIIGITIIHLFEFIRQCVQFEIDNSLTIVQIFDYFD